MKSEDQADGSNGLLPELSEATTRKRVREMFEILDEGFLVQQHGINPNAGEKWKSRWVCQTDCDPELVANWHNRKAKKLGDIGASEATNEHVETTNIPLFLKDGDEDEAVTSTDRTETTAQMKEKPGANNSSVDSHIPVDDIRDKENARKYKKAAASIFLKKTPARSQSPRSITPLANSRSRSLKQLDTPEIDVIQPMPLQMTPVETTPHWLMDAVISSNKGMLVVIRGSSLDGPDGGWHQGHFEGLTGVILSVFNVRNDALASTARTKLQTGDSSQPVFAIPIAYLQPVEPEQPGQKALILAGENKGKLAIIREEENDGWFVSAGNVHFEIARERLVQVVDLENEEF